MAPISGALTLSRAMRALASSLSLVFVVLLAACGPTTPPFSTSGLKSLDQPIIGGTADTGDPAVVLVAAQAGNGSGGLCSGEVVSPHVILTAAHCVAPQTIGANAQFGVFTGASLFSAEGNDSRKWIGVQETAYDQEWSMNNLENGHDVGVVVLSTPTTITPLRMNHTPLGNSEVGESFRIVGYGVDSGSDTQGQSAGTKRQGTTTVSAIDPNFVMSGNSQVNTCEGDSGGAGFLNVGGQTVLAGITSFGDQGCQYSGADTRVDVYAVPFIDPYIAKYDAGGQSCPASGNVGLCADSRTLVSCSGGAYTAWTDCSNIGYCSTVGAGAAGARCVSKECVASATDVPAASQKCGTTAGQVLVCDASGQLSTTTCGASEDCSEVGEVHCVPKVCPATGDANVCADSTSTGQCHDGAVVSAKSCGSGNKCEMKSGRPTCVAAGLFGCDSTGSAAAPELLLVLLVGFVLRRRRQKLAY